MVDSFTKNSSVETLVNDCNLQFDPYNFGGDGFLELIFEISYFKSSNIQTQIHQFEKAEIQIHMMDRHL